jgi:hypothetical protein
MSAYLEEIEKSRFGVLQHAAMCDRLCEYGAVGYKKIQVNSQHR